MGVQAEHVDEIRSSSKSMPWAWILGVTFAACSPAERDTERPTIESASPDIVELDGLDAAIAEHWRAAKVTPTSEASDAEFLRRVTLDLIGRIPTPQETATFMARSQPDKRAALVDDLLGRDAWAEHWAELYSETLLGGATQLRPRQRQSMQTWLEAQLHEDARWDTITTAVLTARGDADDPGPAGFLVAHGRQNRVEGLTGQTARVFLGLQLQCAQCHDDPDDRFTQQEFYGLAAYYARTRVRFTKTDGVRVPHIVDKPRGEMRMPTEHDDPGARSGVRVAPEFPAIDAEPGANETRRKALARGIVGSEFFARAAVNHAWSRVMGRGIIEPWDDLGDLDPNDAPLLLTTLADEFEASGYDLRALLRTIVLSSAYQRSSEGDSRSARAREHAFAQAALRPMSASQLLRSLMVATGLENVKRRRPFDTSGNVPQALLLLNGELTNQGVGARGGALALLLREQPDPEARIDALFVRLYGRPPDAARRRELITLLASHDHRPEAYEDLMHAMLVSSEFLTIH